jgi:NAD(P)-dependent dehydrogenase (short-subunit alcohol dehydrogenase family)
VSDGWAVVLGASTGTGAAVARALARERGLHVFGAHRGHHLDAARALEADVVAAGRRMAWYVGDAGTSDGTDQGLAALREVAAPRSVEVVVHALANGSVGHFLARYGDPFHPRQFEKTFASMAHSFAWWTTRLVEQDLLRPGGALILGLTNPLHDQLMHQTGLVMAAKAALEAYVRQLAVELGPLGHRVNLLKFGTVVTPALRAVLDEASLAAVAERHARTNATGRLATTEEVGRLVAWLADPRCDGFRGATIDFTGGMTLRLLDLVLNDDSPYGTLGDGDER